MSSVELRSRLNISSLEDYRTKCDLIFLYKLLDHTTDCSDLLSLINFRCSTRILRDMPVFSIKHYHTNYGKFSPINRIQTLGNDFSQSYDLVDTGFVRFKHCLTEYVRNGR
uniref:Uncharacterized protein LOC114325670 n=1 Tax=Diabrotica virgifera virgifera TaxID=50390 RepID=A0A6P7F7A7_DIAVI